jgi:hypothetical protein
MHRCHWSEQTETFGNFPHIISKSSFTEKKFTITKLEIYFAHIPKKFHEIDFQIIVYTSS